MMVVTTGCCTNFAGRILRLVYSAVNTIFYPNFLAKIIE